MTAATPSSDALLALLFSDLPDLRSSCDTLAHASERTARNDAGFKVVTSLCASARAFRHSGLPTLISFPGPLHNRGGDLTWITKLSTQMETVLNKPPLVWPSPPGLYADLKEIYFKAEERNLEYGSTTYVNLRLAMSRIQRPACFLMRNWQTDAAVPPTVQEAGTLGTKLNKALAVYAVAVTALQGPGAINQFIPDLFELKDHIVSISLEAARQIDDLSQGIVIQMSNEVGLAEQRSGTVLDDEIEESENRNLGLHALEDQDIRFTPDSWELEYRRHLDNGIGGIGFGLT